MTSRAAPSITALLLSLAALLVGVAGAGAGTVPAALAAGDSWTPPGDTITAVSGSARHGFRVDHYDGATEYLPTLSEALAECGEYGAARDRLRCRVAVRTRYGGLGDTRRALRLAHAG